MSRVELMEIVVLSCCQIICSEVKITETIYCTLTLRTYRECLR